MGSTSFVVEWGKRENSERKEVIGIEVIRVTDEIEIRIGPPDEAEQVSTGPDALVMVLSNKQALALAEGLENVAAYFRGRP